MRAVVIEEFAATPTVRTVPDPDPAPDGVVIEVEATGICRSDWHTLLGHDPDVTLPHVAGHEFAGVVTAVGSDVHQWRVGDRVTAPFVCACGRCPQCAAGHQQICDRQFQPGATHWGSFAEFVAIDRADINLIRVPDGMLSSTAAALGCRFATAFRAVYRQGGVGPGDWVAVHGCGGAGLSAVLLAVAAGARVVAVDVSASALDLATAFGAVATVDAGKVADTARAVREITGGGAHVSLDCVGLPSTCAASVASLCKRGTHVQVGLLPPEQGVPPIPMHRVIADELRIVGSHGLAAHEYPRMLELIERSGIDLGRLVGGTISLSGIPEALMAMNGPAGDGGITVAEPGQT
ncbi:D-arabinose 1-dehydrogenase, Zn-dependent alcohol dehydrogenase family [Amycolatopsis marina]|uniref:D-arabinose 1-dehydrogenase, Zn-dependent alcohol dehydrogenase family n=1 Tax=Amycolatopsis marina TaxID=490629 RepID=A0A1I0WKP6_9PSEU|nr:zinc-dependent alcohol dehydrogenase family protein [Amycolatopsis marina]SFA89114.1 D-arabinose 1-dehydrogenase, Zn-dependent alcohol dehydrogenase family [Amycolatopsis marina]